MRGFHCDSYGHVNNARYLEFLEEARWASFEVDQLTDTFNTLGLQFFVVNINVNFKLPVLPEQVVEIKTSLGEVKRKTMTFVQEISVNGTLTTTAEVTFVLFDTNTQSAATIEEDHVRYFKSLANV